MYQRIFYPLSGQTFFSLGTLNKAIGQLLGPYNDYHFHNRLCTRRQQFLDIEQSVLDPLPPAPYQLRHYRRAAQGYRAGYRIITNILKNKLDQTNEPELPLENHIPTHGNIRGGDHYQ